MVDKTNLVGPLSTLVLWWIKLTWLVPCPHWFYGGYNFLGWSLVHIGFMVDKTNLVGPLSILVLWWIKLT